MVSVLALRLRHRYDHVIRINFYKNLYSFQSHSFIYPACTEISGKTIQTGVLSDEKCKRNDR